MPTDTAKPRRHSRGRGRRARLAIAPVAFIGTPDAHRIDARDRIRPHVASMNHSVRTLARTDEYLAAARDSETRWHGVTVSFPGRDSLGRANPRMARRAFA